MGLFMSTNKKEKVFIFIGDTHAFDVFSSNKRLNFTLLDSDNSYLSKEEKNRLNQIPRISVEQNILDDNDVFLISTGDTFDVCSNSDLDVSQFDRVEVMNTKGWTNKEYKIWMNKICKGLHKMKPQSLKKQ
jgi:hypothetical protein